MLKKVPVIENSMEKCYDKMLIRQVIQQIFIVLLLTKQNTTKNRTTIEMVSTITKSQSYSL